MREYKIFLIREPLSIEFYGKEHKIYQLVHEFYYSTLELKKIIEKQLQYITEPIPLFELHTFIRKMNPLQIYYYEETGEYLLELADGGKAQLKIYPNELLLSATGTLESETIFFELLRKFRSTFLAIDVKDQRFGWLRPIAYQKYI
ncbi:sporulation inhibitor of replication protein SirA [Gottfriedia luciferensis]|uniref:sporulation inhibitor of replication protein SirA n=1 Tax=Gottfriedia luciferensis TaxID=178774 RepID=UPI000B437E67|nr:sporulation inhibitor of replication protein SirA [Gottfriedia luciferensis]